MKKLIFLLIMLMAVSVGAENSKYGSMWKQNDSTVSPADDVVYVDFTGYSTVGITGGNGSSFENISVSDEAYLNEISGYDIMLQGVFGSGTSLDVAGAGTRCFFYPKKAAWRCGQVGGASWDDANIGDYSHAEGVSTTASNTASHAEGNGTIASGGNGSHAEGLNTSALGIASHAEGNDTTASGTNGSHAEGLSTLAQGQYSHAEGTNTIASANAAHAQGNGTTASGLISDASGYQSIGAGYLSVVNGEWLKIDAAASNSVMFGSYADGTERDANPLTASDTFKLANMNLVVDGGFSVSESITTYDNYSVVAGNYIVFAHATSTITEIYLPEAASVDGMHLRFQKEDSSGNHININAVGGDTIEGNGFRVLEALNNAITLYSGGGTEWHVLQATSVSHFGEIHVHDNSTATTIDTISIPHLIQGLFSEEDSEGFDFVAGSTGPIAAFAEYSTVVSGTTQVTDVDHGLATGALLSIAGTTSYNGVFKVTIIDTDNFYIIDTFVADDGTGTWYEGDKVVNSTGKTAKHMVEFHGFGTPETNNDILAFHLYKEATVLESLESKGKFTSSTDVKPMSASGLVTLADGEAITFAITNTTGAGDFTMEHLNIVIHSF